ncbi:hypothetical protein [Providencia phage Kokobel2]|nr:hypothetical protein [Providencia phage Kokobel2]
MEKANKVTISLASTNIEHLRDRSVTDDSVLEAAKKALEGGLQYGLGTPNQPTIFNIDGEKVKAYQNPKGDITIAFTGTMAEKPRNAPIDLA